jgi:hypothetical protein
MKKGFSIISCGVPVNEYMSLGAGKMIFMIHTMLCQIQFVLLAYERYEVYELAHFLSHSI